MAKNYSCNNFIHGYCKNHIVDKGTDLFHKLLCEGLKSTTDCKSHCVNNCFCCSDNLSVLVYFLILLFIVSSFMDFAKMESLIGQEIFLIAFLLTLAAECQDIHNDDPRTLPRRMS